MKKESYLRRATFGMGFVLLMVCAVMLQIPGTVGAQEQEYTLEDTVVTATKTGETDLQKTGIAISVFDEEYLEEAGINSLFDLDTYLASFEFINMHRIMTGYIRGIGSRTEVVISGESGVAYYLDGVYLNQGRGAGADFFDIERIEVLKGPQGVLFGGNATGGAMNFITKRPKDELELMARVEVGNYATRRVDARIAGPLIEGKLRASLTFLDAEHDGYIDNLSSEKDARSQNDWGVRGMIQILPSDSVEIALSADYSEQIYSTTRFDGKAMFITDSMREEGHVADALAAGYPEHYLLPPDFWTINLTPEHMHTPQEIWGVALFMDFKLPHDMTLRSITAHRDVQDAVIEDLDMWVHFISYIDNAQSADQTSQELTLNGTWGPLEFVVGGFYFESLLDNLIMAQKYPKGQHPNFIGTPLENLPVGTDLGFLVEKQNWALYTNLSYAVTDKLNLSAGVRYSNESKDFVYAGGLYLLAPDGSLGPPLGVGSPVASDGNWSVWTPKFAIEYLPTEDIFIYASYAEGFKSGMLWGGNLVVGLNPEIDPEYVETWELGVKTDWLDKRLRVNASVFTNDQTDAHGFKQVGRQGTFQNIGSIETKGVELEVVARPIQGLTLSANAAYLDAKYGEFEDSYRFDDLGDRSVAGTRMAYIPEWKATLNASYTLTLEEAGFLTFGANIAYRDDVPTTKFPEDPYAWMDARTIVDATIRYETEDGRWALEGYARNLFETKYYQDVWPGDVNTYDTRASFVFPGDPRRMGVKVTYTY